MSTLFLVFMRVYRLLGAKSEKRFYRGCPNIDSVDSPPAKLHYLLYKDIYALSETLENELMEKNCFRDHRKQSFVSKSD